MWVCMICSSMIYNIEAWHRAWCFPSRYKVIWKDSNSYKRFKLALCVCKKLTWSLVTVTAIWCVCTNIYASWNIRSVSLFELQQALMYNIIHLSLTRPMSSTWTHMYVYKSGTSSIKMTTRIFVHYRPMSVQVLRLLMGWNLWHCGIVLPELHPQFGVRLTLLTGI